MKTRRWTGRTLAALLALTLPGAGAGAAPPERAPSAAAADDGATAPRDRRSGAAGGVGELLLDRRAVTTWLSAALPARLDVEVPGIGSLTLLPGRPQPVRFVDGGLELTLPLSGSALGSSRLELRLVPSIEPLEGRLQLAIERATWRRAGLAALELGAYLPPLELPRLASAELAGAGGTGSLRTAIQGVVVGEERLRLDLGFLHRDVER